MKEIEKQNLMNQLSILTALQRINYNQYQEDIIEDLSQRIKETQKFLSENN